MSISVIDAVACHHQERERIHMLLMEDARRGFEDIAAGRTHDADSALAAIQKRRTVAVTSHHPVKKLG